GRELAGDSPARFGVKNSVNNPGVQMNQQRRESGQTKKAQTGTAPVNSHQSEGAEPRKPQSQPPCPIREVPRLRDAPPQRLSQQMRLRLSQQWHHRGEQAQQGENSGPAGQDPSGLSLRLL